MTEVGLGQVKKKERKGKKRGKNRIKQITWSTSQISSSVFIVSDGRRWQLQHKHRAGVRWTTEEGNLKKCVYIPDFTHSASRCCLDCSHSRLASLSRQLQQIQYQLTDAIENPFKPCFLPLPPKQLSANGAIFQPRAYPTKCPVPDY